MSTHKHFDKICCVVLVFTLLISLLFFNAEKFGVEKSSTVMQYTSKLFDTSKVHEINIIMDNWEDFTANCKSEEYYICTVTIDNEVFKNVAIRGKGNTSLSQVSNDRYSYKIEFDHYDSSNTYYGLDKLCLNNIIQDNTYMKDYLTYQMMLNMNVAAPLCSYAYITVNGEDWGLYLAVEGVEESFLQRNFGKEYGELYKPDSTNLGGGRGNGEQFDSDEFFNNTDVSDNENNTNNPEINTVPDLSNDSIPNQNNSPDNQMPENIKNGEFDKPDENKLDGNMPNGNMPDMNNSGNTPPDINQGNNMQGNMQIPNSENNGNFDDFPKEEMTLPENFDKEELEKDNFGNSDDNSFNGQNGNSSMLNGSDDVLLKYIDDNQDSYSNIFDNAKTDIDNNDKDRLISSLKNLNNMENLENTLDIDAVIRYFVVHNFVLNFDSYTGSMIHNYYLYEDEGKLQMIPWDYNLAFGGFQSMGDATNLVNYPIDSPVSGGNTEDRPMLAWIFENDEYTELYHKYFSEFITEYFDSGYFETMIDNITEMISHYVEKDPTKFCTYEEFTLGISTLKEMCLLRAESVSGQLDGTIGSTDETQDKSTFINADNIQISDMGTMNMNNQPQQGDFDAQIPENNDNKDLTPQVPPEDTSDVNSDSEKPKDNNMDKPSNMPDNNNQMQPQEKSNLNSSFVMLAIS